MAARPAVLIVDDEPVAAAMFIRALESKGIGTLYCDNAEEALVQAKHVAPLVVVSDVEMPGMGGIEFCRAMASRGLRSGPILFLTGHDDLAVVRQGLSAGVDDFLLKGSAVKDLQQRIFFWIATGFRTLPAAARTRAIEYADAMAGEGHRPIAASAGLDDARLKDLAGQVSREVGELGEHYGERMIERIHFVGRLSHLVLESCTDLSAALRFPDYLLAAVGHVDFPWVRDLKVIFAYYEQFAQDPRFQRAAREGLGAFADHGPA